MRKFSLLALVLLLSISVVAPGSGQQSQSAEKKAPEPMKLKVGDMAPDFTLLAFDGTQVTPVALHDYRGKKNVALAFYVFAFTGG